MHSIDTMADHAASDGILRRNLLRDAVFQRLLTRILRLDYRRGQRLRLDAIAADMGVSRTPVREALVPLETLRLVSVQRYVGVVIAPWGVENMVERLRIVQNMLDVPASERASIPSADVWDPAELERCASQVGLFAALAEWVLRRFGHPVSADWVASQRPVLDLFYSMDVASVHGIDISVGAAERGALLIDAQAAVLALDLRRAAVALDAFADDVVRVGDRFRPVVSSRIP
ncbi:GntR family transcriptional regulator [Curtobacterium sp. Leaf261]|uniref:GntR family transcriptional regulator n=1 Tax=Curtobacterium sp. Leaf261 TaxID=1736311 RepID=UPI000713394F|nr:GntR family transcriptional regulator [Curtobacterium sp. Leaf261]KQO60330.1 hypothetical protein ASF23_13960 [Curtobacterium sp. Leaf261]